MATIGTFTRAANGTFSGTVRTLSLNAKVTLRPSENGNDRAPDLRAFSGSVEIGAGWTKTSREEREYVSLKLDDPSFSAPIYASLIAGEVEGEYNLIWSR